MDSDLLINRIQERAHDPEQAVDMVSEMARVANPPVTRQLLKQAESALGFALSGFLRQLYLRVGNGGFGPGYGLIALRGEPTLYGLDLIDLYLKLVNDPPPPPLNPWPRPYLMIADWGCNIVSVLNMQDGSVLRFNGDDHHDDADPWESVMLPEAPSLDDWFEDWLLRPGRERFASYR